MSNTAELSAGGVTSPFPSPFDPPPEQAVMQITTERIIKKKERFLFMVFPFFFEPVKIRRARLLMYIIARCDMISNRCLKNIGKGKEKMRNKREVKLRMRNYHFPRFLLLPHARV